jgi:hypothetical protein
MDVEVLIAMREEYNTPPPVSNLSVVSAWTQLPVDERLNTRLRERGDFTLEDIATFNSYPDWQQSAALQLSSNARRADPVVAAQVLSTMAERRGIDEPGYSEAALLVSEITPAYVDTLHYVGMGSIRADQIVDLTTSSRGVTELRDIASRAGIYPQAGHNMPDYCFYAEDAVALSHAPQERIDAALGIAEVFEGYGVSTTRQLAQLVASDLEPEEVRVMLGDPSDGQHRDISSYFMDALMNEVPVETIREAMMTPYDGSVKGVLIHTPELRSIVASHQGNDVLAEALPLVKGLQSCTKTDTDALSWLISHAEESDAAREAVFDALKETPNARVAKSPWQHAVMRVLDGSNSVPRRLGGVSSSRLPKQRDQGGLDSWV